MPTILVTGAQGQVGRELQLLAEEFPDWDWHFRSREELDLTERNALDDFFAAYEPDYCLNCAAYTAVDLAEEQPERAFAVNVLGVRSLAEACAEHHCFLIHLSTDYVYHGSQTAPFRETDPTHPRGVYARTKLEGEQMALQVNRHTMVIRTSWLYAPFGKNFVRTMLRMAAEGKSLRVVDDQIGSPTYALDLARLMLTVVERIDRDEIHYRDCCGVFNYSNAGSTTWYGFAEAIFALRQMQPELKPIPTSEYPTPAERPPNSLLDKSKITALLGLEIPDWKESLAHCLQRIGDIG